LPGMELATGSAKKKPTKLGPPCTTYELTTNTTRKSMKREM
jgi:hypothetical protein